MQVFEGTAVEAIEPGRVRTAAGDVRAGVVVRATEGFTVGLAGEHRTVAPVYSLMVATEPLAPDVWDELGLAGRPTFNDARHLIIYGQRTADGRIAFGGRGAPYHFGSRIDARFDRDERVFDDLRGVLRRLFPGAARGLLHPCLGWAAGHPARLALLGGLPPGHRAGVGRRLRRRRRGHDEPRRANAGRPHHRPAIGAHSLAWVDHRSPRWEPEPLRWIGINGALRLTAGADRAEARTGRPSRWRTKVLDRLTGG